MDRPHCTGDGRASQWNLSWKDLVYIIICIGYNCYYTSLENDLNREYGIRYCMWFRRLITILKKYLHNVAERNKSMREGRYGTQYEIICDEEQVRLNWLTVENETGTDSFSWGSVVTINACQQDLFAVDQICIELEFKDHYFTLHENMKGWKEFLDAVEAKFPGFPTRDGWITKIMKPAFARNYTRLWPIDNKERNDSLHPSS